MIPTLERLLAEVEALLADDLATRELCSLWLDLVDFRKQLDVVVRSVEEEATEALHEEFGDDRDGVPRAGKSTLFETAAGPVRLEREPLRRRSYGRSVVEVLAHRLHDSHGEFVPAVPVAVLREVLPHAASEEKTGYAWRWKQLRELLGPEQYVLLVDEPEKADRPVRIVAGEGWP